MSERNVRLFVIGDGDAELQSLIMAGVSELGRTCEQTRIESDAAAILERLAKDEIPIVIKPAP